jgi:hypothetical protein
MNICVVMQVLVNNGVNTPQFTSILQIGKKDLPSFGVEDQFSKSQYTNKPLHATMGLCESRVPGKFTPRKQFESYAHGGGGGVAGCLGGSSYNPSGDPSVLMKWSKGIDLNVSMNSSSLNRNSSMGSLGMSQSASASSIFG